jgi:hypothetical protein
MPYTGETSYLQQNMKTVAGNLAAFRQICRKAAPPIHIVEGMGGIGNQTKVLRELFTPTTHEIWDKDSECCEILRAIPNLTIHEGEFPTMYRAKPKTLLVLDYNMFTLLHMSKLLWFFGTGANQVIITDTARGKFHLHPHAYKMKTKEWSEYVDILSHRLTEVSHELVAEEKAPRSLTYFLARRL